MQVQKTKILNSAKQKHVFNAENTIWYYIIGKADIFKINNIYMAPDFSTTATTSHTDITDRFDLDNGQRDNFYDIGRLKLKNR